jgi:hypothetical protein
MKKSNLTLRSNIHILAEERPYKDPLFLSKIVEINTLRRLCELVAERRVAGFHLATQQYRILQQNMPCSAHPDNAVTLGVIRSNGALFQVVRCQLIETCRFAIAGRCKEYIPVNANISTRMD